VGSILSTPPPGLLWLRRVFLLLVLPAMGACSAMPPAAPGAPLPPPPRESPPPSATQATTSPASIPEAQTQFDAAERDLRQRLAARSNGGASRTNPPGPVGPPGPANPAAGVSPDPMSEKKEEVSDCALVCRALASMRRAADTICRLDGDQGSRCSDARSRVSRSVELASQSRCSCAE
jgi:hypothetical protein